MFGGGTLISGLSRRLQLAICLLAFSVSSVAQSPATSGTFTLHKFARPIGTETYSIEVKGDTSTLTSHFLFTDRGTKVPLETTFIASTAGMTPVSYTAKGRSCRQSAMDDSVTVSGKNVTLTRNGKSETVPAAQPWFVTDGYSPTAMQEQMMRWWLKHGKP